MVLYIKLLNDQGIFSFKYLTKQEFRGTDFFKTLRLETIKNVNVLNSMNEPYHNLSCKYFAENGYAANSLRIRSKIQQSTLERTLTPNLWFHILL